MAVPQTLTLSSRTYRRMKAPDFTDEIGAFHFVHKCAVIFLG